jgi:hypothetical protein
VQLPAATAVGPIPHANGAAAYLGRPAIDLKRDTNLPAVVSFDPGHFDLEFTHRLARLAGLPLFRSSVRGHRSEVMFGVLVVVLCSDHIAGQALSSS